MRTEREPSASTCPVSFALEIFGDRWTLLVLRDILLESLYTYKDILAANKGMATSVLADRLKRLQRRGLISKARDASDARQFIYRPTKLGVSVIPMLVEMIVWGAKHGNGTADSSFIRRLNTDRDNWIKELQSIANKAADRS
jgi:DNA-binding HxlR family transcriptional regulator